MPARGTFTRSVVAVAGAAALALLIASPADATVPRDFDAPIFGTTATITALRMPSVAAVQCSDAACTTGVLPAPVVVDPAKYTSKTVASGGVFSGVPGFVAKVNKTWNVLPGTKESTGARLTLLLGDFAAGTDTAAAVAQDASIVGATLAGPNDVNGLQVWSATVDAHGSTSTYVYVASGATLSRAVCSYAATVGAGTPCQIPNVTSLLVATVQRPAPARAVFAPRVVALVPDTPAVLTPVVMSSESSPLVWDAYEPSPALSKQLRGTKSALLQYSVKGATGLYFMAYVAPVESKASHAYVKTICGVDQASQPYTCKRTDLAGPADGYLARYEFPKGSKKIVMVQGQFTGGGRLVNVDCSSLNVDRGLTGKEQAACTRGIEALSVAVVG